MNINEAIAKTNKDWKTVPDGSRDSWDVAAQGDCEDYAFRVLYNLCDQSWIKFVWTALFGGFHFWYVEVGTGKNNGHFVMELPDGTFVDNIFGIKVGSPVQASLMTKPANGYVFKKRYWKLMVLWKILVT